MNCIHYVEKDDVAVLEYLMQGWERPGVGVFGGRWERPSNVFSAAKDFKKKLDRQTARAQTGEVSGTDSEESGLRLSNKTRSYYKKAGKSGAERMESDEEEGGSTLHQQKLMYVKVTLTDCFGMRAVLSKDQIQKLH